MNVYLLLIILGTITAQGARLGNQQEKSTNLNAKRYYEPEPCARVRGGECRPVPKDPHVWPCPSFMCPGNPCPEPQFTVCCCPGNGPIYN